MHTNRFLVNGRGQFPVDMLRHDRCWPVNTSDAMLLLGSDQRTLLMAGVQPPTKERWMSFGWVVVE